MRCPGVHRDIVFEYTGRLTSSFLNGEGRHQLPRSTVGVSWHPAIAGDAGSSVIPKLEQNPSTARGSAAWESRAPSNQQTQRSRSLEFSVLQSVAWWVPHGERKLCCCFSVSLIYEVSKKKRPNRPAILGARFPGWT